VTRHGKELQDSSFPTDWTVRVPLPPDVDTNLKGNKQLSNGIHAFVMKKKKVLEADLTEQWAI
jgi:hypothetical protein